MTSIEETNLSEPAQKLNLRQLTPQQLAQLGVPHIAYVKPVFLDGKHAFAIHAADGSPMALAEERDMAIAAIVEHEMLPALVH